MVNMTEIVFPLGARVRFLGAADLTGTVIEHRGPLAPKGAQVYGIRMGDDGDGGYVEVQADQIELLPAEKQPRVPFLPPAPRRWPTAAY